MVASLVASLATLILLELFAPTYVEFFHWNMSSAPVVPRALPEGKFHTLLSHNWATGQVQ